ncbi:MAG: PDZ domain-containing protein [Pirellulaceae bacterium]
MASTKPRTRITSLKSRSLLITSLCLFLCTLSASGQDSELPATSEKAFLGLTGDATLGLGQCRVLQVREGFAAWKAGVRPGDQILQWNDTRVESIFSLAKLVQQHAPGDSVRLLVRRQDRLFEFTAVLDDQDSLQAASRETLPPTTAVPRASQLQKSDTTPTPDDSVPPEPTPNADVQVDSNATDSNQLDPADSAEVPDSASDNQANDDSTEAESSNASDDVAESNASNDDSPEDNDKEDEDDLADDDQEPGRPGLPAWAQQAMLREFGSLPTEWEWEDVQVAGESAVRVEVEFSNQAEQECTIFTDGFVQVPADQVPADLRRKLLGKHQPEDAVFSRQLRPDGTLYKVRWLSGKGGETPSVDDASSLRTNPAISKPVAVKNRRQRSRRQQRLALQRLQDRLEQGSQRLEDLDQRIKNLQETWNQ